MPEIDYAHLNLKQFMSIKEIRNIWIYEDPLEAYVRKNRRMIEGTVHDFLDIANLKIEDHFQWNQGIFTRFITTILHNYPTTNIYVENILNPAVTHVLQKFDFKFREPADMYLIK